MKFAVWGRPAQSTREWLLATFWTREQAEQFRAESVAKKAPIPTITGEQVCEVAAIEDYDGNSAIGEGRALKKATKYKPRYQRMVTEVGPNGIKRFVRATPGKAKSTSKSKTKATTKATAAAEAS